MITSGASGSHIMTIDRIINTHGILVDTRRGIETNLSNYSWPCVDNGLASDSPLGLVHTASGWCAELYTQMDYVHLVKIYDVSRPFGFSEAIYTNTLSYHWDLSSTTLHTGYDPQNTDNNVPRVCPDIEIYLRDYTIPASHTIGGIISQMCLPAWLHELQYESDSSLASFIRKGISCGFNIIDLDHQIQGYDCENYSSVLQGPAFDYVNKLIMEEIKAGKLLLVSEKPTCIHSLGAVDKSDGAYRPTTDCHRPVGTSINCFMQQTAQKFKFINLDMVADVMTKQCFMSSIDISHAYRSIHVNPEHWTYQGLRWEIGGVTRFLVDTRLCLGISCAPYIYSRQ